MTIRRSATWFGAMLGATLGAGCSLPARRADFASNDPQERTLAVAQAARTEDRQSVVRLIELLESSDPAERMFAIGALERMTGQTLGYAYWESEPVRREAVGRWVAWSRGVDATVQSAQDRSSRPPEPAGRATNPPSP